MKTQLTTTTSKNGETLFAIASGVKADGGLKGLIFGRSKAIDLRDAIREHGPAKIVEALTAYIGDEPAPAAPAPVQATATPTPAPVVEAPRLRNEEFAKTLGTVPPAADRKVQPKAPAAPKAPKAPAASAPAPAKAPTTDLPVHSKLGSPTRTCVMHVNGRDRTFGLFVGGVTMALVASNGTIPACWRPTTVPVTWDQAPAQAPVQAPAPQAPAAPARRIVDVAVGMTNVHYLVYSDGTARTVSQSEAVEALTALSLDA